MCCLKHVFTANARFVGSTNQYDTHYACTRGSIRVDSLPPRAVVRFGRRDVLKTHRALRCSLELKTTTVKRHPWSRRCISDSAAGPAIPGVDVLGCISASLTVEGMHKS